MIDWSFVVLRPSWKLFHSYITTLPTTSTVPYISLVIAFEKWDTFSILAYNDNGPLFFKSSWFKHILLKVIKWIGIKGLVSNSQTNEIIALAISTEGQKLGNKCCLNGAMINLCSQSLNRGIHFRIIRGIWEITDKVIILRHGS